MVEVFKTNIKEFEDSQVLVKRLRAYHPEGDINFDLEDCDSVLRVEDDNICAEKIIELLIADGYKCEVLTG